MTSFRLIIDGPQGRYRNMAVDEALLRRVNLPVLRIYRWAEPAALSIGYFEKAADVPEGRPFVRRYTGGGLVDHRVDLTYTLALPKDHPLTTAGTGPSYEAVHRAVNEALLREGFEARLTPVNAAIEHHACFEKAVRFDVVGTRGQKLAGAAQRRTREGCLHQGSILPPGPFDRKSLTEALVEALSPLMGGSVHTSSLQDEESILAADLERSRYGTTSWNHSR